MTRPHSIDLRARVVTAVVGGVLPRYPTSQLWQVWQNSRPCGEHHRRCADSVIPHGVKSALPDQSSNLSIRTLDAVRHHPYDECGQSVCKVGPFGAHAIEISACQREKNGRAVRGD